MSGQESIEPRIDRHALKRQIDRLDLPADIKAILASLLDASIEVGGRLLDVGARVLDFTFDLARAYPGVTFGVLAALVLSYLIGSIPMFGPLLSPFLTPLLLLIGIGFGVINDMKDGPMRRRLDALSDKLQAANAG